MRFVKIPKKKKGEFRLICAPSSKSKRRLKYILKYLNELTFKYCDFQTIHSICNRSVVSNAVKHKGFNYTLNLDLDNFYHAVTPTHILKYFPENIEIDINEPQFNISNYKKIPTIDKKIAEIKELFNYDIIKESNGQLSKLKLSRNYIISKIFVYSPDLGRPITAQGLPTSSAAAALAITDLVEDIKVFIKTIGDRVVLSIYADDISLSFNQYETYKILKEKISQIIESHGFKTNPSKTHLMASSYGKRRICGVMVSDKIEVSRKVKRRIKSLEHNIARDTRIYNNNRKSIMKIIDGVSIVEYQNAGKVKISELNYSKKVLDGLKRWSKLKFPSNPPKFTIKVIQNIYKAITTNHKIQLISSGYYSTDNYIDNCYRQIKWQINELNKNPTFANISHFIRSNYINLGLFNFNKKYLIDVSNATDNRKDIII